MSRYDYCIIGTGIGGSVLASKLRPNGKVIVVEAGKEKDSSSNVTYENVGLPFGLRATTSIQLGGTSNLWHGVLSKMDEIDFKQRDWIPNSGWPIELNDLEPFYEEAAKLFRIGEYSFFEKETITNELKEDIESIDFNRNFLTNKLFQQPLPTLRLAKLIENCIKTNPNTFKVLTNTPALKINFDESGETVKNVLVGMEDGTTEEITAKKFIICAGALETPRILLNSRVKNENIGKYLMDHPMGNLCQIEFRAPQKAHIYSDKKYDSNNKIKSGLIFDDKIQKKYQLPNHNFYLRPSFKKGINDESEKIKLAFLTFLSGKIYPKDIVKMLTNINVVRQILAYKFTLDVTYKFSDLFFVTEQIPFKDSKVDLSNKTDKWGFPIARVDWQLTPFDISSMKIAYKILRKSFSESSYDFVHNEADLDWENVYTSAAHHVGTARMATSKVNGVVDKNLKVFGTNNLFVCDGSVFTTSGNVNSGFTIAALACRLANYLEMK